MFEYAQAFLKPFSWAKSAYENLINTASDQEITISEGDLVSEISNQIPSTIGAISSANDWNRATGDHVSDLAALYVSIDKAASYITSMEHLFKSRIVESEKRLDKLSAQLKGVATLQTSANTSINIRGGEQTWVETDSRFYTDSAMLVRSSVEGVFRLPSTNVFSSIRSLGGFAGTVRIEKTLSQIEHIGNLESMADGDSNTFWMGTFYSPAPVRADDNDVPWVPDSYKHGFPLILTYYLDRPTNISEVYIDPVSTDPFDLIAIRWSPTNLTNSLPYSTFPSSSLTGWTFYGNSSWLSAAGIGATGGIYTGATSGWVSYSFALANVLTKSVSGVATTVASGDFKGQRIQVTYAMRGVGDCKAGCRVVWYNSAGAPITYKLEDQYPTGFFKTYLLTDIVPSLAVSGRVDFGIFAATSNASAYFDNAVLLAGEQNWNCNLNITKPTTVPLPSKIISDRVSFVISQRNPRQERILKQREQITPLSGYKDIDSSLQKTTQILSRKIGSVGSGQTVFSYRVGIKELDLRYREFISRGCLVSLPLVTSNEIRRLWSILEVGKHHTSGVGVSIYPFADNEEYKIAIDPFIISGSDSVEAVGRVDGEILHIFTPEEAADPNWAVPSSTRTLIVEPRSFVEEFDGSDRTGKIKPKYPAHIRKNRITNANNWLSTYSLWSAGFDPNAEVLYGVADSSTKENIQQTQVAGFSVPASAITTSVGYIPLKLTVQTDKWVAIPDTFGRPDVSKLQAITGEILETAALTRTITEVSPDVIGFDSWAASTTIEWVMANSAQNSSNIRQLHRKYKGRTIKVIIDSEDRSNTSGPTRGRFQKIYDGLKAANKLPQSTYRTDTTTNTAQGVNTYKTKFAPVIVGANHFKLWWYNSTSGAYIAINPADYTVRAEIGQVEILTSRPSSGYADVVANYIYTGSQFTETLFDGIVRFISNTASGTVDPAGFRRLGGRRFPVTRNMTDYVSGKVPTLRHFDMDYLSKDYYPVIEYYVSSTGELVLSRDFFKYGDLPAKLKLEYESLGLNPRVRLDVTRSNFPSASTSIQSLSLKTRESIGVPIRGVE